jgi:large subunit ribosomal protein L22
MANNYSFQNFDKETMARSSGTNLKISLKKSVEVLKAIRGKKVSTVINYLNDVINQKAVVPYTRYNSEMPHKRGKGIYAGGYPVHVAKEVLVLVKNAQKNALEQEISGELYVISASARKGTQRYHFGRYSGRKMKSTNVEIIVGVRGNKK